MFVFIYSSTLIKNNNHEAITGSIYLNKRSALYNFQYQVRKYFFSLPQYFPILTKTGILSSGFLI